MRSSTLWSWALSWCWRRVFVSWLSRCRFVFRFGRLQVVVGVGASTVRARFVTCRLLRRALVPAWRPSRRRAVVAVPVDRALAVHDPLLADVPSQTLRLVGPRNVLPVTAADPRRQRPTLPRRPVRRVTPPSADCIRFRRRGVTPDAALPCLLLSHCAPSWPRRRPSCSATPSNSCGRCSPASRLDVTAPGAADLAEKATAVPLAGSSWTSCAGVVRAPPWPRPACPPSRLPL